MLKFNPILFIFCTFLLQAYSQKGLVQTEIRYSGDKDYTKIFQNALSNKSGDSLRITVFPGTYRISSAINTERNFTTLEFKEGAWLNFISEKSSGILLNNDYTKILNAAVNGNGRTAKDMYTGFGIMLYGVDYCEVRNCILKNISGNNIIILPSSKKGSGNNKIIGNKISSPAFNFSDNGDEAAILLGYSGVGYQHNNNFIEKNTIDGNNVLKLGIAIISHGINNIIINNKVSNLRSYGITAYESAYGSNTLRNTLISHNYIENIGEIGQKKTVKGMGIYLLKSHNSIVKNNTVINAMRNSDKTETLGAGSISLSVSPNALVSGNMVTKSGMYGIVSDYSFQSQFLDNKISETAKSGMYFINMNDVLVQNNEFKNIGDVVIKGYFQNTKNTYEYEKWKHDKYYNLDTGNNFKIIGNKFYTNKDVLYFEGTPVGKTRPYGNKIKNNIIENNEVIGATKKQENLFHFRQEVSGSNKIRNNKILN